MKKFAFIALALLFASNLFAERVAATDSRIVFVGRALMDNGSLRFDWPSSYFRIKFSGKDLTMKVSDTKRNFYNVWIDAPMSATPHRVIEVTGNDTIIELVDPLYLKQSKIKEHEVVIQKRTEAGCGTTTVHTFATNGKFLQASPLKVRQLEFIGDSYTCGYGADATSRREPFRDETENASHSYASIVSRYFGADYVTIAHSGRGVARNYASKFPWELVTDLYRFTLDRDSTQEHYWDASSSDFKPAMTIIYLGANDFSTSMLPSYDTFYKEYLRLMGYIKSNYGEDHPILCVATKTHEYLFRYIRDMVNTCGLKHVDYLGYFPAQHHNTDEDLGAAWHPNYNAHQKIAYSLIPYIATITGWGLQDMPVK